MRTDIKDRLLLMGLTGKPAEAARDTESADAADANPETDLVWPPKSIEAYDFETREFVSFPSRTEPEGAPAPPRVVVPAPSRVAPPAARVTAPAARVTAPPPLPVPPPVPLTPSVVVARRDEPAAWQALVWRYHRLIEASVIVLACIAIPETVYLTVHLITGTHSAGAVPATPASAAPEAPDPQAVEPQAPSQPLDSQALDSQAADSQATDSQAVESQAPALQAPDPQAADPQPPGTRTAEAKPVQRPANPGTPDAPRAPARDESPTPARPAGSDRGPQIPAAPAFGRLVVTVPIQLQMFEKGVFLGTSDTPIQLADGSHELELVNDSVRYREHMTVRVQPGKTTRLPVVLPTGRLQVNAVPWSEVLIDGKSVGDTPLGNLRLPIGPHRVVFRHPQLGEQTRTVVVNAAAPVRLTVDLRQ